MKPKEVSDVSAEALAKEIETGLAKAEAALVTTFRRPGDLKEHSESLRAQAQENRRIAAKVRAVSAQRRELINAQYSFVMDTMQRFQR